MRSARAADHVAGQQHLHRVLARHGARQGDHRGRAEQADIHARRAEPRRSAATARSQLATSWQPAAVATPVTSAITGLGQVTMDCMTPEHSAMIFAKNALPPSGAARPAVSSFRS
jgi:hypothetical protein